MVSLKYKVLLVTLTSPTETFEDQLNESGKDVKGPNTPLPNLIKHPPDMSEQWRPQVATHRTQRICCLTSLYQTPLDTHLGPMSMPQWFRAALH